MFAVVRTGGKQYKANLGEIFEVEKLEGEAGDKVELEVLASGTDLSGKTKVVAQIVKQKKGEKVIIFKRRRRKNSQRKNGHRQNLTVLQLLEIGSEKFTDIKKPAVTKAELKAKEAKTAPKAEVKAEKPAAKKAAKAEVKVDTAAKAEKAEVKKAPAAKKAAAPKAEKPAAEKKEAKPAAAKKPAAKKATKKDTE